MALVPGTICNRVYGTRAIRGRPAHHPRPFALRATRRARIRCSVSPRRPPRASRTRPQFEGDGIGRVQQYFASAEFERHVSVGVELVGEIPEVTGDFGPRSPLFGLEFSHARRYDERRHIGERGRVRPRDCPRFRSDRPLTARVVRRARRLRSTREDRRRPPQR